MPNLIVRWLPLLDLRAQGAMLILLPLLLAGGAGWPGAWFIALVSIFVLGIWQALSSMAYASGGSLLHRRYVGAIAGYLLLLFALVQLFERWQNLENPLFLAYLFLLPYGMAVYCYNITQQAYKARTRQKQAEPDSDVLDEGLF